MSQVTVRLLGQARYPTKVPGRPVVPNLYEWSVREQYNDYCSLISALSAALVAPGIRILCSNFNRQTLVFEFFVAEELHDQHPVVTSVGKACEKFR